MVLRCVRESSAVKFFYYLRKTLNNSKQDILITDILRLANLRTPILTCDGNLRFKHLRLWRDNRLTGIRQNMNKLLNILFSNILGRISRVTEGTFIRTRSDGRMVIICGIFKPPSRFTTTHHRGASQFNWAPIFSRWKAFCILFLRYRPLKLGFELS